MKLNEIRVYDQVRLRIPDANSETIVEVTGEITEIGWDDKGRLWTFQIEELCESELIVCKVEVRYIAKGINTDDYNIQYWVDIKYSVPAENAELTVTRVEKVEI